MYTLVDTFRTRPADGRLQAERSTVPGGSWVGPGTVAALASVVDG